MSCPVAPPVAPGRSSPARTGVLPGPIRPSPSVDGCGAPPRCRPGWRPRDARRAPRCSRRRPPASASHRPRWMVESMSMVIGPSPGPAPKSHALASICSANESSWRTWPKVKERRNVPRVDGAITSCPSTLPVDPERSTSQSSMHSAPATMACTRVAHFAAGHVRARDGHRGRPTRRPRPPDPVARTAWPPGRAPHRPPPGRRRRSLQGASDCGILCAPERCLSVWG